MTTAMTDYTPTVQRDGRTWTAMLRGENGPEQQRTATEELTRHFSVAALRCVRNRRNSTSRLIGWSDADVVQYARDVVDATMAELLLDDFREFDAFSDERFFTIQAAQLIIDHIAADLDWTS